MTSFIKDGHEKALKRKGAEGRDTHAGPVRGQGTGATAAGRACGHGRRRHWPLPGWPSGQQGACVTRSGALALPLRLALEWLYLYDGGRVDQCGLPFSMCREVGRRCKSAGLSASYPQVFHSVQSFVQTYAGVYGRIRADAIACGRIFPMRQHIPNNKIEAPRSCQKKRGLPQRKAAFGANLFDSGPHVMLYLS